jgi:hypothetical protein
MGPAIRKSDTCDNLSDGQSDGKRKLWEEPLRIGRLHGKAALSGTAALFYVLLGYQASLLAAQSDQGGIAPPRQGGSQVQILPPQSPRLPAAPAQSAPGNELQIPSLQQAPDCQLKIPPYNGSQSAKTIQQAFFGCWSGTSLPSDTSFFLGGCPEGYEVPELQKLCFTRVENHGYQIAYQSAAAALPNFQDHTELISSQGEGIVNLSDVGSYDMFALMSSAHVTFGGSSRCELSADKDILRCQDTSLTRCNGLPWYRTTGRIVMRRVPR